MTSISRVPPGEAYRFITVTPSGGPFAADLTVPDINSGDPGLWGEIERAVLEPEGADFLRELAQVPQRGAKLGQCGIFGTRNIDRAGQGLAALDA